MHLRFNQIRICIPLSMIADSFSNGYLFSLRSKININDPKKYRSMCFLSSYGHLKFDFDRFQINMLKYFCQKMSERVNSFFLKLYIFYNKDIRSIKIMCKNYRFMCELFKTIIYLKFCFRPILCNIGFLWIL